MEKQDSGCLPAAISCHHSSTKGEIHNDQAIYKYDILKKQVSGTTATPSSSTTKTASSWTTAISSSTNEDIVENLSIRKLGNTVQWQDNPLAWGCLESLVPGTKSKYLTKESYSCGKSKECEIVIQHPLVSQNHCRIVKRIVYERGAYVSRFYVENYCKQGTFVNDLHLKNNESVALTPSDILRLTEKRSPRLPVFRFRCPNESAQFARKYNLGPLVGSGCFGNVFKATRRPTSKFYAVKMIDAKKFIKNTIALKHLRTEVDILLTLDRHPCIVDVYQVYEESLLVYIVLEYFEFGDLFSLISLESISEAEARFIFRQLVEATKFLHEQGVVHRDIKPENVLVAEKNKLHVKLTDFGLAKVQEYNELFTTRCGTPVYVAPEVLDMYEPKEYGKGCDLWSLGAVLYVCLCRAAPFDDSTSSFKVLPKSQEDVLKSISRAQSWSTVSEDAKGLVQQLLTVDPNDRATIEDALTHPWILLEPKTMESMLNAVPIKFD